MPDLETDSSRLTFKLVYYGPALSGKTTNLVSLHDCLSPEMKGEVMTLDTQNDRTLYFDLFPLGFRAPTGILIKFRLFTVPGQVRHDSTRKAVLSRADGVVFVADSLRTQETNNAESFQNLSENAGRVGLDFDDLPLVVQFNKRDLPNILTEAEIVDRWQGAPWPLQFASALNKQGVVETFADLLGEVYTRFDPEMEFQTLLGLSKSAFVAGATGSQEVSP
ncbi:MAG: GTPase domain-containing protein [Formivibrio sp.]|nr:GTPase domain-containing protein [Formivibrio sp.]